MSYTEWQIFDSSSIAAGRYDVDSSVLEIQFNEGKMTDTSMYLATPGLAYAEQILKDPISSHRFVTDLDTN
jgi:hypothetical protein